MEQFKYQNRRKRHTDTWPSRGTDTSIKILVFFASKSPLLVKRCGHASASYMWVKCQPSVLLWIKLLSLKLYMNKAIIFKAIHNIFNLRDHITLPRISFVSPTIPPNNKHHNFISSDTLCSELSTIISFFKLLLVHFIILSE